MRAALDRRTLALGRLAHRLGAQTPAAWLARVKEQIKGLGARLPGLAERHAKAARQGLEQMSQRLARAMTGRLALEQRDNARRRGQIEALSGRFARAHDVRFTREQKRLAALAQMLNSLGYKQVLARGYAVVRSGEGVVRAAAAVETGQMLSIEFADGRIGVIAEGDAAPRPAAPRPVKPKPPTGGQGSLF